MAVKTVPGLLSHVPFNLYSFLVTPLYTPLSQSGLYPAATSRAQKPEVTIAADRTTGSQEAAAGEGPGPLPLCG